MRNEQWVAKSGTGFNPPMAFARMMQTTMMHGGGGSISGTTGMSIIAPVAAVAASPVSTPRGRWWKKLDTPTTQPLSDAAQPPRSARVMATHQPAPGSARPVVSKALWNADGKREVVGAAWNPC